jgi:threonine dehydrogenase-like Zn-dependent dehydrogenase
MKAISLVPGTTNISLKEVTEPQIIYEDEIKMKMLQVGICGTDREQVSGGRAMAPNGQTELIIGHEMFGQVIEIGNEVESVKVGDYGVFSVRRGCGKCIACNNNRSDMCFTGEYTERGIKGADGFQAQFVVDKQNYFIEVPSEIKELGVLTEPMSVAAKAIDEALIIQGARFQDFENSEDWFKGKKALVAGIGAIGILAAFALRLRGAEVYGMDIVDRDSLRPRVLEEIGGKYVNGKEVQVTDLDDYLGNMDFVFEAVGLADLQIELIDALGVNGIYVATGIPEGNRPITLNGSDLMRQLVLKNQVVLGSVNASIHHYKMAVADLNGSFQKWPGALRKVVTERIPFEEFEKALHEHSQNEIKVIVDWE